MPMGCQEPAQPVTRSQRVRIREIMRLHIQLPALAELQQRSVILHSNVPPSFIDPEYSIIGLLYHLMLAMKSMAYWPASRSRYRVIVIPASI